MRAFFARYRRPFSWAAALTALAVVVAAHLGPAPGVAAENAPGTATPLAVLHRHVKIDFGREIEVSAEIDAADLDVEEVRVVYRLAGPDQVSHYTYAEFEWDGPLVATFTVSTGGAKYYPPGAEFQFHFELTDAGGGVQVSAPFTVEYLDPSIEWRRIVKGPVTVVYHGLADRAAEDLVDHALARLPAIAETAGVGETASVKAVLFSSVREATPYFPRVSQTATDRQFFAGFAMDEYGLFIMASPSPGIFVHEMTHLLVGEARQSAIGRATPAWLNEGLAVYFQHDGDSAMLERNVRNALRRGEMIPLRNMNRLPGRRSEINLFYPQSGHLAAYLIDTYGRERIASLLAELETGAEVAEAFESAYGESMYDVENEWRAALGVEPLPTPGPEAASAPAPVRTQIPLYPPPVDTVVEPGSEEQREPAAPGKTDGEIEAAPIPTPQPDSRNATTMEETPPGGGLPLATWIAVVIAACSVLIGAAFLAGFKLGRRAS